MLKNVELRRDNQAQRQADPNRQEDYVHMKIDVDESMRELMQTEIRKYHSGHYEWKLYGRFGPYIVASIMSFKFGELRVFLHRRWNRS